MTNVTKSVLTFFAAKIRFTIIVVAEANLKCGFFMTSGSESLISLRSSASTRALFSASAPSVSSLARI